MKLRHYFFPLLFAVLALSAFTAFAQPTTFGIQNYNFALHIDTTDADPSDYERGGGAYVPDGTLIYIIRDTNNSNTQDCPPTDVQPPQVPPDIIGALDYNVWPMNSISIAQDGSFDFADIGYCVSGGGQPFPSPSKFFLVVPIVNPAYAQQICWVSNVVNVNNASGLPQDFDVTSWSARVDCWTGCLVPERVSGVSATDANCVVTITWNNVANEDSFVVYRYAQGGSITRVGRTLADVLTINDTPPTAFTNFAYRVKAFNSCGVSDSSVADSGKGEALLGQVTGVSATDTACAHVRITWTNIANEDSFQIRRNGVRIGRANRDSTNFLDATAVGDTIYTYRVVAYSACGAGDTTGTDQGKKIGSVGSISSLSASDNRCDSISIAWFNVVNEDGFEVRRNGATIATVGRDVTNYTDFSLAGAYSYQVIAFNACGSTASPSDSGTKIAPMIAVTGVTASDTSCNAVYVNWNNNTVGEDSFQIRRNGTRIGAVSANITSFSDLTAPQGVASSYTVVAYNLCGEGAVGGGDSGLRLSRAILVLSPNGAEQWIAFQTNSVTWSGGCGVSLVKLELNRNYPNEAWELLIDSTANDGNELIYITDPLSNLCRIRVRAVGDTVFDISDANFTIRANSGYLALVRTAEPTEPVISWDADSIECPQVFNENFRFKNFGTDAIVIFSPNALSGPTFTRTTNAPGFFALSPGQMSSYSVTLNFDPPSDGLYRDTLRMQSDAINAVSGYVKIPLIGSQISSPLSPQIVITRQGINIQLDWQPVTLSTGGCPVTVTYYLVYYSPFQEGPYYYLTFTSGTTANHLGVVQFATGMFYQVQAYTGSIGLLGELPQDGSLTMEEIEEILSSDQSVGQTEK